MFWCDMRKPTSILYFISLVLLQLGYFVPPIETSMFSLNIINIIAFLIALVGAGVGLSWRQTLVCGVGAVAVTIVYLCANSVSHDYLIFLNPVYLFVAVAVGSVIYRSFSSKLFFSLLCIVLCETGTLVLIKGGFAFYPLFCPDVLDCTIPLVYLIIIESTISGFIQRRKYVKSKNI